MLATFFRKQTLLYEKVPHSPQSNLHLSALLLLKDEPTGCWCQGGYTDFIPSSAKGMEGGELLAKSRTVPAPPGMQELKSQKFFPCCIQCVCNFNSVNCFLILELLPGRCQGDAQGDTRTKFLAGPTANRQWVMVLNWRRDNLH